MAIPQELTPDIRRVFSDHFAGWVMSSTVGKRDEVCTCQNHKTAVYVYEDNKLISQFSLLALNKNRALTEFTRLLKSRRAQ